MRTVLAIAILTGAVLAPASSADAARKLKRGAGPPYYAAQPRYYAPRRYAPSARSVCEERARNEDPAGQFAGYPCWAREIFGRGSGGGRGR